MSETSTPEQETSHEAEVASADEAPARPRRWPLIVLVTGVVVAVAVAVGLAIADGDDDPPGLSSQLAAMHSACQEWAGSSPMADRAGRDEGWCGAMTEWMGDQMRQGHMAGSMMPMMGQDRGQLRETCQQWMATDPPTGTSRADAEAWCDDMAQWMDQHRGDWDRWMPNR